MFPHPLSLAFFPELTIRLSLQSDGEEPLSPAPEAAEEIEVPTNAPTGSSQMSVLEALKGVLKLALIHDGLARGLREASKALDRRQAHMCVLNEGCEEEAYKKLVVALCAEHNIPLIKVQDGKQLGEWAGLCTFSFRISILFSFPLPPQPISFHPPSSPPLGKQKRRNLTSSPPLPFLLHRRPRPRRQCPKSR